MQYSVYRLQRSGRLIVDVQANLLSDLPTRTVIPLLERAHAPRITLRTLNPMISFGNSDMILMTEQIVSIPFKYLTTSLGSLAAKRDQVVRAIDMLLSGV